MFLHAAKYNSCRTLVGAIVQLASIQEVGLAPLVQKISLSIQLLQRGPHLRKLILEQMLRRYDYERAFQ